MIWLVELFRRSFVARRSFLAHFIAYLAMSESLVDSLPMEGPQILLEHQEYHIYILLSFLFWAFIHHLASRWIFKNNPVYCALSKNMRMEWDSRLENM